MKAVGYTGVVALSQQDAFVAYETDTPVAGGRDLLVEIKAIGMNPVDTKVRQATTEAQQPAKVLGWDAAGVVQAVGEHVSLFKPGDEVFYAGDITRPGCNASHQLVDERIVGRKPETLSFAEAAAMPLTAITAWEALFDRLGVDPEFDAGKRLLIIGAAGGVGSIAIQLASQVAQLQVIATASRPESSEWCLSIGADIVIDHYQDMPRQLEELNIAMVDYILCLNDTDHYFPLMAELIAPQGMICSIVGSQAAHNLDVLKSKSAGFVWEFMFTRSMYQTEDMIQQHELLNEIARLVDESVISTTLQQRLQGITPENVTQAHEQLETGRSIGKIVLEA